MHTPSLGFQVETASSSDVSACFVDLHWKDYYHQFSCFHYSCSDFLRLNPPPLKEPDHDSPTHTNINFRVSAETQILYDYPLTLSLSKTQNLESEEKREKSVDKITKTIITRTRMREEE